MCSTTTTTTLMRDVEVMTRAEATLRKQFHHHRQIFSLWWTQAVWQPNFCIAGGNCSQLLCYVISVVVVGCPSSFCPLLVSSNWDNQHPSSAPVLFIFFAFYCRIVPLSWTNSNSQHDHQLDVLPQSSSLQFRFWSNCAYLWSPQPPAGLSKLRFYATSLGLGHIVSDV